MIAEMITREEWLLNAVEEFRPYFEDRKLKIQAVQVSCGFPSKSPLSKTKRLGECWASESTFDGSRQIFVTPLLSTPVEVLGVLIHELIHASLDDDAKHGPKFKAAMKDIGLEGKATATIPSLELIPYLEAVAEKLGDYPNTPLKPRDPKDKKAQAKKSFKLFCAQKRGCTNKCSITDKAIGDDYTTTCGKKVLALGFPHCPCGEEMEMETEEFALYQAAIAD